MLPAAPPPDPAAPATLSYPRILINEVEAAAWNGAKDSDGDAKDWVELYNPTPAAVDLGSWGLSNKAESAFRWVFPAGQKIPANGYLVVWLSKKDRAVAGRQLHASFNLDNGADSLYLTVPNGTAAGQLVDSASPAFVKQDQSWCRTPNGQASAPFVVCTKQTPGAANSGTVAATTTATPIITPRGGVFTAGQTATITGTEGAQIRYTLDGSEPTTASTLYTGPIPITTSRSLRATAFGPGALPSLPATESYVIDSAATTKYADQRVVMVSMTPAELNAYKSKTKDVLFATPIDVRERDGAVIFRGEVESKVGGQLGSLWTQAHVPLNIKLREARGVKSFKYDLFPNKPTGQEITGFRLRNSGNDWYEARLRDSFAQSLMAGSNTLWSDYSPTVLFINGQYSGLMDMRQVEDETLVESSTGTSKDAVEFLSDGVADSGGTAAESAYAKLNMHFLGTDMSKPANYAQARKTVDVENIAVVTAAYGWSAIFDWPWRNMNIWRSSATDNLWRYQIHDLDITQDLKPTSAFYVVDTRSYVDMTDRVYLPNNWVFASLMKNPEFKQLYLNAVADQLNYTFEPKRANAQLDTMVAQVKPYIPAFRADQPQLGSAASWETKDIARLRSFVDTRGAYVDAQHQRKYKLSARVPMTFGVNDVTGGSIKVNTLPLATVLTAASPSWSGSYYPQVPVTVTAQPVPGYRFVRWEGASTATTLTTTVKPQAGATLTAVFGAAGDAAKPAFAPVAAITSTTGDVISAPFPATDPGGFQLTYDAKKLPKGLDIDPASGRIWGTVTTPGTYAVRVIASNGSASGEVAFTWVVQDRPGTGVNSAPLTGLVQTDYWKNATWSGTPAATEETPIGLKAGLGAPRTGFGIDNFSVRWATMLTPAQSGRHTLKVDVAPYDGVRVTVGGVVVLDKRENVIQSRSFNVPLDLTAGVATSVRIDYVDKLGEAKLSVTMAEPGSTSYGPIPGGMLTAGIPAGTP